VPESVLRGKYEAALDAHKHGRLDAAEAQYRDILRAMPTSFHALHMLGVLVAQRDDLAQSERLIAEAVRIDPAVAAAHANLGNTLRLLERADDAMASYDRALKLQPTQARALKGRGLILWERGRYEEALACYETLLQVEPGYADGWIMKGSVLRKLGRNDEATASFAKALSFEHVDHPERLRYMLASFGAGDLPAASPVEYIRDLFDTYAHRFDRHLVGNLDYRGPELLVAELAPWLAGRTVDVLDLGCGTGLCGVLLRPSARTLTGVDLSANMLDEARRKEVYDALVEADIVGYLGARAGFADLVVAADVFIYLGDLAPVFAGAFSALRAGGLFAFSTEIYEAEDIRLMASLRYAHAPAYLARLAEAGGWRVESVREATLRREEGREVRGQLTVLRRPAKAEAASPPAS
jgi:predicted TPR repeat methyltransferase